MTERIEHILPVHVAKVRHNAAEWLKKVKDGPMQKWASWIIRPDEIVALCDEYDRLKAVAIEAQDLYDMLVPFVQDISTAGDDVQPVLVVEWCEECAEQMIDLGDALSANPQEPQ